MNSFTTTKFNPSRRNRVSITIDMWTQSRCLLLNSFLIHDFLGLNLHAGIPSQNRYQIEYIYVHCRSLDWRKTVRRMLFCFFFFFFHVTKLQRSKRKKNNKKRVIHSIQKSGPKGGKTKFLRFFSSYRYPQHIFMKVQIEFFRRFYEYKAKKTVKGGGVYSTPLPSVLIGLTITVPYWIMALRERML